MNKLLFSLNSEGLRTQHKGSAGPHCLLKLLGELSLWLSSAVASVLASVSRHFQLFLCVSMWHCMSGTPG